jgi:hypothetical protein
MTTFLVGIDRTIGSPFALGPIKTSVPAWLLVFKASMEPY